MAHPQRRSSLARIGRRVSVALGFGKRRGASSMQQLQVHLLDGSVINLSIKPTTTVASVLVAVRRAVSIDLDCDYALYMTTGDGAFAALDMDTRVQQAVAKLPAILRGRARFFYKRKVYIPGGQTEEAETRCSDPHQAAHRMSFIEAAYHYLQGNYRFNQAMNVTMSALLLQSHDGDHNPDRHGAENLLNVLPYVYPATAIGDGEGASQAVATAVAEQHGELRGLMPMEAQVTFLNKAKGHPAYGCDFFPCKRTWRSRDESGSEDKVKMRTEDVMVAIGKEGVHLWSLHDPFDIANHGYDVITKWTVSKDGKVFAFCVGEEVIVYLVTTQAATIEAVIEHYVHDLVAMRTGLSRDPITAKDAGSAVVTQIIPPPAFMLPGRFHIVSDTGLTEAGVMAAAAFADGLKKKNKGARVPLRKAAAVAAAAAAAADANGDEYKAAPATDGPNGADVGPPEPAPLTAGAPASAAVPAGVPTAAPQPPRPSGTDTEATTPPLPDAVTTAPATAPDAVTTPGTPPDIVATPPVLPPDAVATPPVLPPDTVAMPPALPPDHPGAGAAVPPPTPAVDDAAVPTPPPQLDVAPTPPAPPADVVPPSPPADVTPTPPAEPPPALAGAVPAPPADVVPPSPPPDVVPTPPADVAAPVPPSDDANSLADGWVEEVSAEGDVYFYNPATGESAWDKPRKGAGAPATDEGAACTAGGAADAAPVGASVATVDLEGQPLPAGWILETDADGYSYYVNTLTEETQWERPTAPAVGADGTVATATPDPVAVPPDGAVVATHDAEGNPLPPGWIMETDTDGYSYFVNTLTDASQWERPTEPAVGADGTVASE